MKKNVKEEIEKILARAEPAPQNLHSEQKKNPSKRKTKPEGVNIHTSGGSQVALGNNITQIGGGIHITTAKYERKITPPAGTIGADPLLVQRIQGLFNQIGLEREKRFGKKAYLVMYANFKRDFGIGKNQKWNAIFLSPQSMAPTIIEYLEGLLSNTISGRIRKAAASKDKVPTRPQLYAKEKTLLEHLGMTMDSQELRQLMSERFGSASHKDLNLHQHMQLVAHLDALVDKMLE